MKFIVQLVAIPNYLFGYLYATLALLLFFAHKPSIEHGVPVVQWRAWFAKRWKYSTTIGRGVGMHPEHAGHPEISGYVWDHEMVHIRQTEDLCAHGLAAGIVAAVLGAPLAGLIIWLWSPTVPMLLNLFLSMMRHGVKKAYRESEHERAAYAHTWYVRELGRRTKKA